MNIGFDAKRAFLNTTGLGNYSRSVITAFAAHYPGSNYYLYTPKAIRNNRTENFYGQKHLHIRTPALPLFTAAWRSRFMVPRLIKDGLDVYHGLSHELPIGIHKTGIKSFVTIHDLIFLRYPDYYKAIDRKIYTQKVSYACKHADTIIATSEQTKQDLVRFLNCPEEKIEVVYQSCAPSFQQEADIVTKQRVKQQYQLPEQYLLNVGTIEERKNLLLVVQALRQIPEELKLVIIGKETPYAATVKKYLAEHQLEHRVQFLSRVSFADLPAIYQQAAIFIYPSRFEGFGIPILEALYSSVPVIAATGSCLEEAGGPHSLYISPSDHQALAEAVNRIYADGVQRETMIAAGRLYATRFQEETQAAQLMKLYNS